MHPHMLRRLDLKPALMVRAMIDPDVQTSPRQVFVGPLLPPDPDIPQLLMRGRQAKRLQLLVLKLQLGFLAKAIRPGKPPRSGRPPRSDLPRRHHDVGMMIADVGLAVRAM